MLTRITSAEHLKPTRTIDSDVLSRNEISGVDGEGRENVRRTGNVQGFVGSVKSVDVIVPSITDGAQLVFR